MKGKRILAGSMLHELLISASLCILWISTSAQVLPFKEYTSDDGLSQAEHHRMIIDSRGYLWRPTRSGLVRFDGITFTTYTRRDGLPSNTIGTVLEDAAGTIWTISKEGVSRFNGQRFHYYPIPDSMPFTSVNFTYLTEKKGAFFLSAYNNEGEIIILYFDNGTYTDFTSSNPLLKSKGLSIKYFSQSDSVFYFLDNDANLYRYNNERLELIFDDQILDLIADEEVIIRTTDKVLKYDGANWIQAKETDIPGTADIISRYYGKPDTLLQILLGNTMNLKWDHNLITQHIIDSQGVLWLTTDSWIYRLLSDAFAEYDARSGLMAKPSAIFADPVKGLWIGSFEGDLQYFDGERFTDRNEYSSVIRRKPSFFRGSTIKSNGEVLISTNKGVYSLDGMKLTDPGMISEDVQVCIIYEDPVDKTILIGSDRGLYHYTKDTILLHGEMSSSMHGVAEGIVRDDNGHYWIASQKSMVFFDGERFTPFISSSDPSAQCWGVIKDVKGNIWSVGSDGLYTCDPDAPAFKPALPDADNLPANVIRDLGDGRLLIGRMSDLCLIDLDKYYSGEPDYYNILGRNQGFRGFDCQDNGIVQDRDGVWWLLTSDKLIRFDHDRIQDNIYPPKTYITRVEYLNDSLEWAPLLDTALFYETANEVTLVKGKNDLRISYLGISTRDPEGVTYQYRLAGQSDDWSEKTFQRSVIFNNIRPGKYTFELNSFNADGVMTPEPETLLINVTPTLPQTTGAKIFISLTAIALSILVAFAVRRSVLENKVRTARRQAENYRLQLSSVIRQFDPHFTFNAVSSVGALIMKGEKEKAYDYFIKLSGLLRSVLTESASLLKPLSEEIEFVTRYCELQKLRFGNRFNYNISIDQGIDLSITTPKMIIHSFVENAVKHGLENKRGSGRVDIEISKSGAGITITIKDNGIGRAAANELKTGGSGLGLKNLTSLIETINRFNTVKITFTLTDLYKDGEPAGTLATVFLPDNYSYDFPLKEL